MSLKYSSVPYFSQGCLMKQSWPHVFDEFWIMNKYFMNKSKRNIKGKETKHTGGRMPQLSCDTGSANYSERCRILCSRLCGWGGDMLASPGSRLWKKWVSDCTRSETAAKKTPREWRQSFPLAGGGICNTFGEILFSKVTDLILTMFLEIKKPWKWRFEDSYSRHFIYLFNHLPVGDSTACFSTLTCRIQHIMVV